MIIVNGAEEHVTCPACGSSDVLFAMKKTNGIRKRMMQAGTALSFAALLPVPSWIRWPLIAMGALLFMSSLGIPIWQCTYCGREWPP